VISIKPYAGLNIKELQLLGSGTQGKVYRINSQRCIKIFKSRKVCKDEFETLMMAQSDIHFPRLFAAGEDYIIRECINGIELNKYLSIYPITSDISNKILQLYGAMMKVGYTRLDSAIFHIFVTPSSELKLIDTAKALKKRTECPHLILGGLKALGYKKEFLGFVKLTRMDLYEKWAEKI
jgi:RIO-like serine/threonine protein kinase fused to N-terminal HTH domain